MFRIAAIFLIATGSLVSYLVWQQTRPRPFVVSGFVEADEIRIGSRVGGRVAEVSVNEGGCLSWQGEKCTLCAEACPVEGAIALDPGGRPRIDPSICTGCGSCLQVCPVGTSGITLTPAQARPFSTLD